ncbi:MAG TPA: TetR/AcrR family transcriptional regulator [Roseiflexaceae bacterium]|nr:TetR/AcrR family transcriptional regulator [Roseiflexaceae bacterium]
MGTTPPQTKAAQRAETTTRLLAIARTQFAEHGYAQAATETIVRLGGVTRGALYHHFGSKEGLFKAVVAEVQRDVARQVAEAAEHSEDPWEQLLAGCRAFLGACLEPDVQRILLIDGPAVLGWEAWRELDAEHAMRLLEQGIGELAAAGHIQAVSVPAVTHLLSGAMNEAVLWIARAEHPHQALDETIAAFEQLLSGLRAQPYGVP